MIAVPFIYFTVLFIFIYLKNKRRFDIACYIVSIYGVSAFFSILMDVLGLRSNDNYGYSISPISAFCYCFLISLCTLPFIMYSNLNIKNIEPLKNPKILKILAWTSFLYFILNFVMSIGDVVQTLSSDMGQIRQEHYEGYGQEIWFHSAPIGLRQLFLFLNVAFSTPWILHFLSFYSLSIQKLPYRYVLLFLFGSLTGFMQGILAAGRSGPIYWMICLGACYLFFKSFMNNSQRSKIKHVFILALAILISYVILTTIARFGDSRSGTGDSLIGYAGQSYINFCFFFDNYTCIYPSLKNVFPLFYYIFTDFPIRSAGEYQSFLSEISGYRLGVFYTFLGQIATTSSNIVAIIYCIVYTILAFLLLRIYKKKYIDIYRCFFYLLTASVLYLGIFGHYYADYPRTSCALFYIVLLWIVKRRKNTVNNKFLYE